jgi:hypothetical protein
MQEGRDEKGRFTEKNLWAYVKKNVGKPPKYSTAEELLDKALEYFSWCDDVRKSKYNEAHLRMWLGFTRKNWHDYKKHPDYCNTMDFIESYMEGETEDKLMWAGSTQGAIFKLKNKYGWSDVTHQEVNQKITDVRANFNNSLHTTPETSGDTPTD